MELSFHQKVSWSKKTYCSYPPWEYLSALEDQKIDEQLNFSSEKINLYFHFPICPKKCPFCFYPSCNFEEIKKGDVSVNIFKCEYHNLLAKELKLWLKKIPDLQMIESIYIGGGTPSYWFSNECFLDDFFDKIKSELNNNILKTLKEITFEVHPLDFDEAVKAVLNSLKDRFKSKLKLSIGIQSLKKNNVKIIRGYNDTDKLADTYLENTKNILTWTKENNILVNIDLMWGLKSFVIKDDLMYIEENKLYEDKIDQITFYHIGSPDDYCRENEYREKIESNFKIIKKQRKYIFTEMKKLGFQPDIYIEYFKKNKSGITNIYNRGQMEGKDYIACGLGGHGKIENLVYLNNLQLESYKKNIDQEYLPIDKFYLLNSDEQKIRNLLLKLRIPETKYSQENLSLLFSNHKNREYLKYFKQLDGKYVLNDKGKYNLPELMMLAIETQLKNNKYFQNKELTNILNKIENYFLYNNPDLSKLKHLFGLLTFDLFKFFNNFLNNKISVLNFAYFSPIKKIPLFGIPYGFYNEKEWRKAYKEWDDSKLEKRISLYEIFFKAIEGVGIPHPLVILKDDVKDNNTFKESIKNKLKNKDLLNKFEDNTSVNKISKLFQIFFGEKNNYLYFLASKNTKSYIGTGGLIFSTKDKLTKNELYSLAEFLELILNSIMQKEYFYNITKQNLKTAIISILVDSFAHNIAAHSLQQILKWLNTRIQYSNQKFSNDDLNKCNKLNKAISEDTVNDFTNLKDGDMNISSVLWNGDTVCIKNLIDKIENIRNKNSELEKITKQYLPLSFDVFRYHFLKYINNKATFWSGAIKDSVLGGTITNWFDILYEFCYNPYFIGTIAGSENIFKVHFCVHCKICNSSFMNINLNNMMNQNPTGNGNKIIEGGENFPDIKNILKHKLVFLPGGDVGRHSLYTIFENCLRNVKHCEQKINGKPEIEFNIALEEKDEKYYDVEIWLSNKSDLYKTDKIIIEKKNNKFHSEKLKGKDIKKIYHLNKDGNFNEEIKSGSYRYDNENGTISDINSPNEIDKILVEYKAKTSSKMTKDIQESIIDENSKPRMGGTYQDKICACQLFTNDFINVEKEYLFKEKHLEFMKYTEILEDKDKNQCCLISSFRVWKGDNYNKKEISFEGEPTEGGLMLKNSTITENIRRFKLYVAKDSAKKKKVESYGVVRVIVDEKDEEENFERYYDKWLDEWIGKKDGGKYLEIQSTSSTIAFGQKNKNIWEIKENNEEDGNIDYVDFAHSKRNGQLICRSHGNISKFFNIVRGHLQFNQDKMNELRAKEFIETILTSVYIIDNRVHNLMEDYINKTSADDILWKQMKIKSLPEAEDSLTKIKEEKKVHFLILHLSYIQDFFGKNTVDFIDKNLKNDDGYIFKKIIITTGRGRGKWFQEIKDKADDKLLPKVMFIPPESLTSAISYGIRIKDDFEIKYRLIKLLMN
ncbi:MAG: radical SAM protein [Promethearchaeota archaeon]